MINNLCQFAAKISFWRKRDPRWDDQDYHQIKHKGEPLHSLEISRRLQVGYNFRISELEIQLENIWLNPSVYRRDAGLKYKRACRWLEKILLSYNPCLSCSSIQRKVRCHFKICIWNRKEITGLIFGLKTFPLWNSAFVFPENAASFCSAEGGTRDYQECQPLAGF